VLLFWSKIGAGSPGYVLDELKCLNEQIKQGKVK